LANIFQKEVARKSKSVSTHKALQAVCLTSL